MARRFVLTFLVALHVIIVCSSSFAATPLVIAELESKRTIAQADSDRATAQHELAAWKLAQLKELRSDGHASWQEMAEQEVRARSASASAIAAEQYLQTVLDWQARLAKLELPQTMAESESIQIYMPRSARLVAWMSTDVASLELSKRHLENLRNEHQSALEIDAPTLEAAIETAKQEVVIYGRSENDAHLLHRAEIQLRLATAEYECAKARKAAANVLARRMVLVRDSLRAKRSEKQMDSPSPALAREGTRFVDATSDRELTGLVKAMAMDEMMTSEQIKWLEQQRDVASDRISALRKLSEYALADHGELDQAKRRHEDLQLQIQQAQQALTVQQRIADNYKRTLDSQSTSNIKQAESTLDDAFGGDANIVRHSLQLHHLKLQTMANRAAIEAQRDYLVERVKRVASIAESARPPKELDHAQRKVRGTEQQLAMVGRELVALDREQQRFGRQVQSQRSKQYQLVQAGEGEFIRRKQFEMAEALIAAVGFVGQSRLFPELPNTYPYIESTIVFDCMSDLRIERPDLTAGLFGRTGWGSCDTFGRRGVYSSIWNLPNSIGGIQLATDWMTSPGDRFCYAPYELRRIDSGYRWASCSYIPLASRYRSRSCFPYGSYNSYDGFASGLCGQSIFSYRIGCPTRSSFPYRSSYLYRAAFPTRSNLYSNPYARPSRPFSGLGYSSWLNASCFD